MNNQTEHDRARIIEAHDTRAQEAYWGGDEEPDADYYERNRQDEIDDAAEAART